MKYNKDCKFCGGFGFAFMNNAKIRCEPCVLEFEHNERLQRRRYARKKRGPENNNHNRSFYHSATHKYIGMSAVPITE